MHGEEFALGTSVENCCAVLFQQGRSDQNIDSYALCTFGALIEVNKCLEGVKSEVGKHVV